TDPAGTTALLQVGEVIVVSPAGAIVATGEEARRRAQEAGAFTGLDDIDMTANGSSVYNWGPWLGTAIAGIERAGDASASLGAPTMVAGLIDEGGLPVLEQHLDISLPDIDIGN